MGSCTWPGGCGQDAFEDRLCYYHLKVADGFVVSTRTVATGGNSADRIEYPTLALARRAADARDAYVREVLVAIWHRGYGTW